MRKILVLISAVIAIVFLSGQVMAEPITINWWHAMKGARGKVIDTMVKAFNDSQSEYVVVATYKGDYDETVNAGVAAYRAKKQPHILQSFEVGTQTMMLSGAVYPVYKLMKDEGYTIDWKAYIQPVLSYYMDADGNLMSMPFNSSTPVMYYNVNLFKKAGIPMLDKGKPITWDQLGEITTKLVKSGVTGGLVCGWQSWTQVENYSAIHNIPFASKNNGYEGLDCELLFNNDKVVKHIAMLKDWMKDNRFYYGGQKYQGPSAEFLAQNAGVYIDSVSQISTLQKSAKDFAWDVAPLPVEAWMKNPQNSIIGGASLWVFNGHGKKDYKGVAAFLKHLAKPEMQVYWHKETGYFPITLAAYEQLKKDGYYTEYPYQEVGIKQLTRRDPTKISRGLRLGYFIQIRNIINEELELVWSGKKTAKEAMDSAVARGNQQLREFEKTYK
ncbi:MAG TPA: sn-glycerol-3-phosphate ABC transporter substrate-binding protein UgpB [Deltaproteobacteria bacterium]|jgi:sn-glycerol 3-phosphate transport system substrate-binding protein|nr:sn-glycerol-3-phosphate ABC transporter substrate-binding protein UgpB [Deltaproteobacteria bacterium]OQC28374.1 MAG: sn-glycerol-3-phosphate-binding periplasmic protein UgpB precursor [Deltaproteobacteria bacterium ADurb.Bin072]HRW80096.1 sn-glycerol-3-phosphate ABC transporter substrate-binding protein UgpB [Desulfomonilia bacterium]NMD39903.1 sn-glycerol-3-phosphate ABC transporter substrate-binding protein UgpB [Deltaproteobacteria bacterium]HNQ85763.1 sn-glycerol-3-phosphate ABC transpo